MEIIKTNGNGKSKDGLIVCQTSLGAEARGTLIKLTRFIVVFEIYNPTIILRASEVLSDFRIIVNEHMIYSGHATVRHLMNMGQVLVCEATLNEYSWADMEFNAAMAQNGGLRAKFWEFLQEWQKLYKILPEFKVVIADMQTFLTDLRLWLEQIELEIRSTPQGDRLTLEHQAAQEVGQSMVPAFNTMHERLETLSENIEEELRPVHQNFSKRQLHSLVLASPFAYRTYNKPLGFAGDYETVNMIVRDPYEGGSLFAKVLNFWFLSQWPARAHRNRIKYLRDKLTEETLTGARQNRQIRVLNLGCGPAREVQEFLMQGSICEHANFTLWDFNEETLQYAREVLGDIKRSSKRGTPIQIEKKSVQQLLKDYSKSIAKPDSLKYDFIYCAGLFDYLPDRTCKQLSSIFYDWLLPNGLLVVTNVYNSKPFRHMLEFILDWHLIYRDKKKGELLAPQNASAEQVRVINDETGVNLFIEVRKPNHA